MSDHDAAVSFVLDYDLSVDDLRESTAIGRSGARRAKSLVRRWEWPVIACAFAAVTIFVNHQVTACFLPSPTSAPTFQLLVWQCAPTSPSDLVWNNTWLFVADGVVLSLLLPDLASSWTRLPRWHLRR